MSEKAWITITAATIAAVATITAALISRPGREDTLVKSPEPLVTAQLPGDQPTVPGRGVADKFYEIERVVIEGTAFTDPETGLTFGVEEVYDLTGSWFAPTMKGATITYRLPDGKSGYGGRNSGFRADFVFRGRSFLMVIEDIDFKARTVTIRVKEV